MLPGYDKTKRRRGFQQLPKGAYVCVIRNAREVANKSGSGSHLEIAFDIAEGLYKGFYMDLYNRATGEKKWSGDAFFYLNVPGNTSESFVWDAWHTFFSDLEDSNNGYRFTGNPADLKGKLIGGKFHIEQTEYKGDVYDHTRLRYTCVADDVRNGKAGRLPADKLIEAAPAPGNPDDFMDIPEGAGEDLPW